MEWKVSHTLGFIFVPVEFYQFQTDAVQTCSSLHETTKTLLPKAGSTHLIRPDCTEGLAESRKNVLTKNNKEIRISYDRGK